MSKAEKGNNDIIPAHKQANAIPMAMATSRKLSKTRYKIKNTSIATSRMRMRDVNTCVTTNDAENVHKTIHLPLKP